MTQKLDSPTVVEPDDSKTESLTVVEPDDSKIESLTVEPNDSKIDLNGVIILEEMHWKDKSSVGKKG